MPSSFPAERVDRISSSASDSDSVGASLSILSSFRSPLDFPTFHLKAQYCPGSFGFGEGTHLLSFMNLMKSS